LLAPLAGRIYHHAPQQNAFPLGRTTSSMSDQDLAESLNQKGLDLEKAGNPEAATAAYLGAIKADPTWSAPAYNLGLMYKYQLRWKESLEYNQRAAALNPDDEASWWNLGIAATALGDWGEARRAWAACGMNPPKGDGPPDFGWGMTPVRLDRDGAGEVVWGRRIDPARVQIENVPLPTSQSRWQDVVLIDGATDGQRIIEGRVYPVFNVLTTLVRSGYHTYVVELASASDEAISGLCQLASDLDVGAEYWGATTNILCYACSHGLPDGHEHAEGKPAHPHLGLAVLEESQVQSIIDKWLATSPHADFIRSYPVRRSA
jgi:hypothetical protein